MLYDSLVTYSEASGQTAVLYLDCMRDVSLVIDPEIRGYVHGSCVTERKTCVPEHGDSFVQ